MDDCKFLDGQNPEDVAIYAGLVKNGSHKEAKRRFPTLHKHVQTCGPCTRDVAAVSGIND